MPVPDCETLMRPVLAAFADGAARVSDIVPRTITEFGITPEEAEELIPSGRVTVVASRAHWARTCLSKAGALSSPKRNHHVITPYGRRLLEENPDRINNSVLAQAEGFEDWRTRSRRGDAGEVSTTGQDGGADPVAPPPETPEQTLDRVVDQLDQALADELLDAVGGLTPLRFEQLIVDLLIAMGYGGGVAGMGRRLGKSGDGGIDGVIDEDPLGLDAVYI